MGDIGKGNQVTSYSAGLDTDTPLANCTGNPCVGGDSAIAGHVNNLGGAIVAIETALGITPQGTAASVAARLSTFLAADGGLPRGTSFPLSPSNVPQLFYRTDQSILYAYNTSNGSWVQLLSTATLSNYVPIASAVTITAQHTFSPAIAEAPFLLGTNALAQKVTGFKADTVASNPDTAGSALGVATLNAGSLVVQNPANATATPTATKIPIADGNGTLAAGWGGNASTLATLNASTLVVQNPANASATPGGSKIPIEDGSGTLNAWATVTPGASKIPLSGSDGVLPAGWAGLIGQQILTVDGTYTPTSGTHKILIYVVGGGGGGGGSTDNSTGLAAGGGGAAGAIAVKYFTGISGTYTYIVGLGGAGVSGTNGIDGTSSIFGGPGSVNVTAPGGQGGLPMTMAATSQSTIGGLTPAATNSEWGSGGSPGGRGFTIAGAFLSGGQGGSTMFGVGGYSVVGSSNGQVGTGYGSGGSGSGSSSGNGAKGGGHGAPGVIVVLEFS